MKAVSIPCDIYESAVYVTISDTYVFDSSEVESNNTRLEYWLIVEDPIRSQIASINAKYDPDLLEAAFNSRLQTLNFAAAIGSTTMYNEAFRLF